MEESLDKKQAVSECTDDINNGFKDEQKNNENIEENLIYEIKSSLNLKNTDPKQLSPLVLAYIGDSIYDLVIRSYLVSLGNMQVNKINKHACRLVKAKTQSEMIGIIEPLLEGYEEAVYKRGRNAKSYTSAKNASITDYRRATGFEALMGYLYLSGKYKRMMELIKAALEGIGEII